MSVALCFGTSAAECTCRAFHLVMFVCSRPAKQYPCGDVWTGRMAFVSFLIQPCTISSDDTRLYKVSSKTGSIAPLPTVAALLKRQRNHRRFRTKQNDIVCTIICDCPRISTKKMDRKKATSQEKTYKEHIKRRSANRKPPKTTHTTKRRTPHRSMSLQTEEQLVNAGIVGQFGVERRSENLALTQTDHIAVDRRFDRGPLADLGNERSANEHQREILEHHRRIRSLGVPSSPAAAEIAEETDSPDATTTASASSEAPKSADAANEPS